VRPWEIETAGSTADDPPRQSQPRGGSGPL
jgi:hypothetical protein